MPHVIKKSYMFITMHLLSLNVAQLPEWLGEMKNTKERITQLCRLILDAQLEPDVLCFQELFSETSRDIAQSLLSTKYPHNVVDERRRCIGVNSGLAVFSRHPIVDTYWMEFSHKRNIDLLTQKGCLAVRIQPTPLGMPVLVCTTHLQAGGDSWFCTCCNAGTTADQVKFKQIEQMSKWIREHATSTDVVVLTGDFNLSPRENPLGQIQRFWPNARDAFNARITSYAYSVADNRRIDYAFVLVAPPSLNSNSTIEEVQDFTLTDHRAVVLQLTLHQAPLSSISRV